MERHSARSGSTIFAIAATTVLFLCVPTCGVSESPKSAVFAPPVASLAPDPKHFGPRDPPSS